MRIDATKSVVQNLIDIVNAVSTRQFQPGDLFFSDPAVKAGSNQTYQSTAPNSTIVISGVTERGYSGTVTRDYRRVPLDAPVGGALPEYTIPQGSNMAALFAIVAADLKWHPATTYTATPAYTSGFGATGATGTVTFTAESTDRLHIGSKQINFRVS